MSSLITQLETALQQSQELLALAEEKQWQALEEKQRAHALLIEQIASADISQDDPDVIRDWANKIKTTDQKTEALAVALRQETIKEQQQQKKVAKMQKALDTFR